MDFLLLAPTKILFIRQTTAANGIVFRNENPYIVDHVIKDGCADISDSKIQQGDELISVDGVKTDASQSREYYFMKSEIPDEMVLGFRRGTTEFSCKKYILHLTSLCKIICMMNG